MQDGATTQAQPSARRQADAAAASSPQGICLQGLESGCSASWAPAAAENKMPAQHAQRETAVHLGGTDVLLRCWATGAGCFECPLPRIFLCRMPRPPHPGIKHTPSQRKRQEPGWERQRVGTAPTPPQSGCYDLQSAWCSVARVRRLPVTVRALCERNNNKAHVVLVRRLPPTLRAALQRRDFRERGAQGLEANVSHSVVASEGHFF